MKRYLASLKIGGMRILLALAIFLSFAGQMTGRAMAATYGTVVISEIMYDSNSATDVEWVELYNPGTTPVDISQWVLTDDDTYPSLSGEGQCQIPASTSIPAGGYRVIAKTNPGLSGAVLCTQSGTFTLANTGDNLALFNPTGQLVFGSLVRPFPALVSNPGDSLGLVYPLAGWSSLSADWAIETSVSTENLTEFDHDTHAARNNGWNNTVVTPHDITADGTLNTSGEWRTGEQLGNVDGLTYYLTWGSDYLYAGMVGGNATADKYNLLIDTDPLDTGASNSGTQTSYCGATFGADGKADYAIQITGSNVYRARATADGSGWEAWPTAEAGGNTNNSASGNAEFFVQKGAIGIDSSSPIGVYLYACNSSSQLWSAWPPENPAGSASNVELTTRTVVEATGADRSPRYDAFHLGYQTLSGATTGERQFFQNGTNASYPWYARLYVSTAGGGSCTIQVKVIGNRLTTQQDGGIRRMYDITPIACSGLAATIIVQYEDGSWYGAPDELRGMTEANGYLYHWDGTTWNRITGGAFRDTPTNRIGTTSPQTTFSPWGIGDDLGNQPTALGLTHLSAESHAPFPWAAVGSAALLGSIALWAASRRLRGRAR